MDLFDLYGANKNLAREIMSRPAQLIDLTKASDEELKKYFWFGAAALIAKHIKDPDILPTLKVAIELFRNIENLGEKQYIEEYLYVSLSYIFEAAEIKDEQEFIKTIREGLSNIDEEKIMTLAQKWEQKGSQQRSIEIARSMILEGIDSEIIVKVTGLSQEQVSKLIH